EKSLLNRNYQSQHALFNHVFLFFLPYKTEVNSYFVSEIEGGEITLNCTYEYKGSSAQLSLQWYKQNQNGVPYYMIQSYSAGQDTFQSKEKDIGNRHSTSLNLSLQSTSLTINRLMMSDSGMYYCALRPTAVQHPVDALPKSKQTYFHSSISISVIVAFSFIINVVISED
uniref:Ig-like domain-containing protein n=1 Tax=Erpetoichthys calabaricus TaxID=27687 RepID=A0A8C4SAL0_ERPCA